MLRVLIVLHKGMISPEICSRKTLWLLWEWIIANNRNRTCRWEATAVSVYIDAYQTAASSHLFQPGFISAIILGTMNMSFEDYHLQHLAQIDDLNHFVRLWLSIDGPWYRVCIAWSWCSNISIARLHDNPLVLTVGNTVISSSFFFFIWS